ncbi:L,D-transpeptidase family protein [Gallaecimonas sp. GXIMD4217]|uniref:L,D-transpeptidase family protein n=1 Tax=Gallaecimonas sp. GXIMD4217 TaxID=3131927 RepID=UPI00311B0532
MRWIRILLLCCLPAWGAPYPLPETGDLIGAPGAYLVKPGDHFEAIARDHDLSVLNLIAANPGVDPLLPAPGSWLVLPSQTLLPQGPRDGIIINLAELRLYLFEQDQVQVYPIGIGRIGRSTPLGRTRIVAKHAEPSWTPTDGIREAYLEAGITLPEVVPPGPDNPLGPFALRLGLGMGEYLIHGTNRQAGVGTRISSGCIRLRNPDIGELFERVEAGTLVQILDQPVKLGHGPDGRLYLEVHEPLSRGEPGRDKLLTLSPKQLRLLAAEGVDQALVRRLLLQQRGLPVPVSP